MKNHDVIALWREEGDLERIQHFFNANDPDSDMRERIKTLTLHKIRVQEAQASPIQEIAPSRSTRFRAPFVGSAWPRIAVSLVAVFLLIWVGKAGLQHFKRQSALLQTASQPVQENALKSLSPQPSEPVAGRSFEQPAVKSSEPQPTRPAMTDSAAQYSAPAPSMVPPDPAVAAAASAAADVPKAAVTPAPDTGSAPVAKVPKIVRTIQISLQTDQEEEALKQLSAVLQTVGGYPLVNQQAGSAANSQSPLLYKVPANQLEAFQTCLPRIGKILKQDTVTHDLSVPYEEAEKRLHDCKADEKRTLDLLRATQNTAERLQAQMSLDSLRAEIEQIKEQLQVWDKDMYYVTIELNL